MASIKFYKLNLKNLSTNPAVYKSFDYKFKTSTDTTEKDNYFDSQTILYVSEKIKDQKYIRISNIVFIDIKTSYPVIITKIKDVYKKKNDDPTKKIKDESKLEDTNMDKFNGYIDINQAYLKKDEQYNIDLTTDVKKIDYTYNFGDKIESTDGNVSCKELKPYMFKFKEDYMTAAPKPTPLYVFEVLNKDSYKEQTDLKLCTTGTGGPGPAVAAAVAAAGGGPVPKKSFCQVIKFKPVNIGGGGAAGGGAAGVGVGMGAAAPVNTLQIGLAVQFLYTIQEFRDIVLSYGFTNIAGFDSVMYNINMIFEKLESDNPSFLSANLNDIYQYLPNVVKNEKSVKIIEYIINELFTDPKYPLFSSQFKNKISFNQTTETFVNNVTTGKNPLPNQFFLNVSLGPEADRNTTVSREYLTAIAPRGGAALIPSQDLNFYVNSLNYQEYHNPGAAPGNIIKINSFDFNNDYLLVSFNRLNDVAGDPTVIKPSKELIFGPRDKFKLIGGTDNANLYYSLVQGKEIQIHKLDNNRDTDTLFTPNNDTVDLTTNEPIFFLYKRYETPSSSPDKEESTYPNYTGEDIACIDGKNKDCIIFKRNTEILIKILEGDRSFYQHMLSLNVKEEFIKQKMDEHIQMSTILEYYRFCNQNDKIQKSAFLQVIQHFIENPIGKWINPENFFQLVILSYAQAKGLTANKKYEHLLAIKDEDFVRLLLFVGRFLPDKNFYIYYKPFGGKIHYINYLYQILRNPANKGASLSDSFFLFLLLGFKILGADFSLPLNQNLGYQSYYEDLFSSAPKIVGKDIIKTVYDRCMFDEKNIFNDSGDEITRFKFTECLKSLISNRESKFIDDYEKSHKVLFDNVMNGIINKESNGDFKYEEVVVETINGAYKLNKIPGYTDGSVVIKGDELLYSAFLNKFLGLLTDNHIYAFKNSRNEKSYVMFNKNLIIVNDDYLLKTPSLSESIQFNSEECLKQTIELENYTKLFDKYENVDLNTCIENCSLDAFSMLLDKGFPLTYFAINKIIYLITIYKDYPIIANTNYLYMLINATNRCVRVDKFQERILNSMANSTLFKAGDSKPQDKDEASISSDFVEKNKIDKTKATSYALEFLTKFRRYKLKDKIKEIRTGEIARSIKNLLFSINIDITKNTEQIGRDLDVLFEVVGGKGGQSQSSSGGGSEFDVKQKQQTGGEKGYFKNITINYIAQVTGLGLDKVQGAIYQNNYSTQNEKEDILFYNPKCIVMYSGITEGGGKKDKPKRKPGFENDDTSSNQPTQSKGGEQKIFIYTPPIFNKILTTRKNADGSDVPEAKLAEIQNTISNLSKMGISPDKILPANKAFEKFKDADEITNDDTNYHYLTIVRLLQMYGLDIKLLTQISTNKMVNILKHFGLIKNPSDEYFFRNLDRSPIDLSSKSKPMGPTIEDELNQQIATFSTYLFYLINNSKMIIPKIIDLFVTLNY